MNTTSINSKNICDSPQTVTSFENTMKFIADFWTLRIIDTIRDKELRFCEIERLLPKANPATLTGRLKRLEQFGAIQRLEETRDKQSVTYKLTKKGNETLPIIEAIKAFTDKQ